MSDSLKSILRLGPGILAVIIIISIIITNAVGTGTILKSIVQAATLHSHVIERGILHVVYYGLGIIFCVPFVPVIILILNGLFFGALSGFVLNVTCEATMLLVVLCIVEHLDWIEALREAFPSFQKFQHRLERYGWQVLIVLPFDKALPANYCAALIPMKKREIVCLCLPAYAVIGAVTACTGHGSLDLLKAAQSGNDTLVKNMMWPLEYASAITVCLTIVYLWLILSSTEEEEDASQKIRGMKDSRHKGNQEKKPLVEASV